MTDKTNPQELHGIQILRMLAALAVVAHHSLEESNGAAGRFSPDWMTTAGSAGVDIFFVISGFIMLYVSFKPHRPPISPWTFLQQRVTRIYPIYWICCLGVLTLSALGFLRHHHWSGGEIFNSFALLPVEHSVLTVSWTLVYEMYFYLLFAMTLFLRSRLMSAVGTTLAIGAMALISPMLISGPVKTFLADPIVLEFCLGMMLALVFMKYQERWTAHWAWGVAGLGVLMLSPLVAPHLTTDGLAGWVRILAWGLPAVLVVASFLRVKAPAGPVARGAILLGDASYSIYLTHGFVMLAYAVALKRSVAFAHVAQYWIVPLVILICVFLGLATHLIIEKPLLALIRRAIQSRQSSVAAPQLS